MIGHFPPPHPDELLYSICARFADQVQYPSPWHVVQDLFGSERLPGSLHLPARLDHLISVMPPGHPFTVDQFIDEHTLFPFYAPFLQLEYPSEIREAMRLDGGMRAWARIGRAAYRWPNQLRVCLHCVKEDRQRFGKCYWHRVHQILGVEVCPLHACYLLNSGILTDARHSLALISAERAIEEKRALIPSRREDASFEQQLAIARNAFWLLNHRVEGPGLEVLRGRYRNLLAEQGLANCRGTMRIQKLIEKFRSYYSIELLRYLHSELIEGDQRNWLIRLFDVKSVEHPLRHLLLIQFLGLTCEAFFTGSTKAPLFGKGPWPCLNPVCEHYHQPWIEHCTITYPWSRKIGGATPRGMFICTCGFCYTRLDAEQSDEALVHLNKVITYGPLWEAALKRLWDNPLFKLKEVAQQLGLSSIQVKFHAARLGLAFPRPGCFTVPSDWYYCPPQKRAWVIDPEKLARYRKEWLTARATYPQAGIKFLLKQVKAVYRWLSKYDADWLKEHTPALKSPCPSSSQVRVDWERRDAQWAKGVEAAALELKESGGSPIRITQVAIARAMGLSNLMFHHEYLEKLPLTKKALISSLEGIDDIAVRRISWTVGLYQQEHLLPTKRQLLRRSGNWGQRNSPLVQQAADDALRMLRSEESSSY